MSESLAHVAGVDLSSAVSVAVARKALEAARSEGRAIARLIRDSAPKGESQPRGPVLSDTGRLDATA